MSSGLPTRHFNRRCNKLDFELRLLLLSEDKLEGELLDDREDFVLLDERRIVLLLLELELIVDYTVEDDWLVLDDDEL